MPMPLRCLAVVAVAFGALAAGAGVAARPAAEPMRLTVDISAAGHDGVVSPSTFAIRAGGTVTLTFRNHTRQFHTFTIPKLGISVLIRPAAGAAPRLTSATFVVPYGVYDWECVLCASGVHHQMHVMRGKMYAIVNT